MRSNKQALIPLYLVALKTVSLRCRCSGVMMGKLENGEVTPSKAGLMQRLFNFGDFCVIP